MGQRRTIVVVYNESKGHRGEVHGARCSEIARMPGQVTWDAYSPRDAIARELDDETRALGYDESDYRIMECVRKAPRVPYGSIHEGSTAAGSTYRVVTKCDEYGRGTSHALTGTTKDGRTITIHRNLSARDALRSIRDYEALGFTRLAAYPEGF